MGLIAQGLSDIGYGQGQNAGYQARFGIMKSMMDDNAKRKQLEIQAQQIENQRHASSQAAMDKATAASDAATDRDSARLDAMNDKSPKPGEVLASAEATPEERGLVAPANYKKAEKLLSGIVDANGALQHASATGNQKGVEDSVSKLVKMNSDVANSMDAKTAAMAYTANGLYPGKKFTPEQFSWEKDPDTGKQAMVIRSEDGKQVLQKVITSHDTSKNDTKLEMNEVSMAFKIPAKDAEGKPITNPMTGEQSFVRNLDEENKFVTWMDKNGYKDSNPALVKYIAMKNASLPSTSAEGVMTADQLNAGYMGAQSQAPAARNEARTKGIASFVDANGNITAGSSGSTAARSAVNNAGEAGITTVTQDRSIASNSRRDEIIAAANNAKAQGKDPVLVEQRMNELLAKLGQL